MYGDFAMVYNIDLWQYKIEISLNILKIALSVKTADNEQKC